MLCRLQLVGPVDHVAAAVGAGKVLRLVARAGEVVVVGQRHPGEPGLSLLTESQAERQWGGLCAALTTEGWGTSLFLDLQKYLLF